MDDLIYRQAAIRFIRDKVSLSLFMKRSVDKADKACMELCDMLDRELPSAQREIIRCKDCKYYHEDVFGDEIGIGKPYDVLIVGHHGCDRWGCGKDMIYTDAEGYCFLAERRES